MAGINLLQKYSFADITVYMRTEKGQYVNLTDYTVTGENEYRSFRSGAKFLISFQSFLCRFYEMTNQRPYACEVTIEELISLSGIHDKQFFSKFRDSDKNLNEELVAMFCANKISDYHYGCCLQESEYTYYFCRTIQVKAENGKYQKKKVEVLKKDFFEV